MSDGTNIDDLPGRVGIYSVEGGDGGNHPVATGWRGRIIHDEELGLRRCFAWSAADPDGTYQEWMRFRDGEWVQVAPGQSSLAPAIDLSRVRYNCTNLQFIELWHRWRNADHSWGRWIKKPRRG